MVRKKAIKIKLTTFVIVFASLVLLAPTINNKLFSMSALAEPPNQVCADAVFTPPLPKSFTNGTSIPFTVDFGTKFSSITGIAAISTYDAADPFGNGDRYFIDNFGGQQTQPGTPEVTTMILNQVDPTVLNQFLGGNYQGKYVDEGGMFTLTSLKFCIKGERLLPAVCPTNNVQHWDKIIFNITSPDLAKRVNLTAGTELDIKVLDDPHKVADIRQKVLSFLGVPTAPRNTIKIIDVDYAIICTLPNAPIPHEHAAGLQ